MAGGSGNAGACARVAAKGRLLGLKKGPESRVKNLERIFFTRPLPPACGLNKRVDGK